MDTMQTAALVEVRGAQFTSTLLVLLLLTLASSHADIMHSGIVLLSHSNARAHNHNC
jgi:hypothetical protein